MTKGYFSMNIHQTGTFLSADGIHDISYHIILPQNNIKGIIQISHGMCEYFDRYMDFAEYMADNGFIVCGNDHLGHGNSIDTDDELGYFSQENGWQNVVSDLYTLTGIMKEKYHNIPYFLFGHSMGSFMARAYSALYAGCLNGAVFCGTSGGMVAIDKIITVIKKIKKVKGEYFRSEKIYKLAFDSYNKKIPDCSSKNDWISRDKEIVDQYNRDPKCTFNFTINGYENLMGVLKYVSDDEWFSGYKKDLPTLLVAGDADPVGDYGKGVYKVFSRLSENSCKVDIKLYSGARHELLNEINRMEVYNDLLTFFRLHSD